VLDDHSQREQKERLALFFFIIHRELSFFVDILVKQFTPLSLWMIHLGRSSGVNCAHWLL